MGSCLDTDIDPPLLPQRVPQRSILGPLLFFYINEMPGVISEDTSLPLFAEDSKCFQLVLCQDDGIKLQEDLNKLFEWSHIWGMKFNVKKQRFLG